MKKHTVVIEFEVETHDVLPAEQQLATFVTDLLNCENCFIEKAMVSIDGHTATDWERS